MPFQIPWTDFESPELERNAQQYWWSCRAAHGARARGSSTWPSSSTARRSASRASARPTSAIVGTFHTGSWLGRSCQGRGIGTEMRAATLHLGFAGFGAARATTAAFIDNAPSLGVTRRLGYEPNGTSVNRRRDEAGEQRHFVLTREAWASPPSRRHRARRHRLAASSSGSPRRSTAWSTDRVTIDGFQEIRIEVAPGVALHVRTAGHGLAGRAPARLPAARRHVAPRRPGARRAAHGRRARPARLRALEHAARRRRAHRVLEAHDGQRRRRR